MHSCKSGDLHWLQRDFAIQLQNVFDTQWWNAHVSVLSGCGKARTKNAPLPFLWSEYCPASDVQITAQIKKEMQAFDWSLRPFTAFTRQLEYAAHDSFFLPKIMQTMLKQIQNCQSPLISNKDQGKPEKSPEQFILDHHIRFNEELLTQPAYQLPSQHYEAQKEKAYLSSFVKNMDFYDPNDFEEYIFPQFLYKSMHILRNLLAMSDTFDCAPACLIPDPTLLAFCRILAKKIAESES